MNVVETNKNEQSITRKFGIKDKIGYSCGSFGNDILFDFVGGYLMVFYTDVFGISPAIVAMLLVFVKAWDAFMDVTAGRFVDSRQNTKHGKYKPSVMRFCIPMAVFTILTFTKIPGLSGNAIIIYAAITYALYGTIHSFTAIPYGASAAVISTDSSERASLSTFRQLGANVGRVFINIAIPVVAFVSNKADPSRFFVVAVGLGIISVISYLGYFGLTIERLKIHSRKKKANVVYTLKGLIRNRAFISQMFVGLTITIGNAVVTTLNVYLFKDYFHNAKAMAGNGAIMALNILLIAPLVGPISKKFGTRESGSVALLSSAIIFLMLFIAPIKNPYIFVVLAWLANAGANFFAYMSWGFVNDVSDVHELITGLREDGTVMSIYQYARKLGQSFAVAISGGALSVIGYVKAAHQTVQVESNIKVIATLIPAIIYFIVFLALRFWYPMSREKLKQLQIELEHKRNED